MYRSPLVPSDFMWVIPDTPGESFAVRGSRLSGTRDELGAMAGATRASGEAE